MSVVKQTVVFNLVYNKNETYAESGAEAISHALFNEDGMIEWDFKVLKETELDADLTEEELEMVTLHSENRDALADIEAEKHLNDEELEIYNFLPYDLKLTYFKLCTK